MSKGTSTSNWAARRKTAAERKTQIIDAVIRLVDKYGVQGTTTARIAAAIGVSEPTLYSYFENRHAMLIAALDLLYDRAEETVRLADGSDPVERLRNIGRFHTRETTARRSGFVSPFFELMVGPPDTGLRERARQRGLAIVEGLRQIIEAGQAQGQIRPEVDARRMAWRILGFYWFEDVSSLLEHPEVVEEGISAEMFDDLIDQMVVKESTDPGS